MPKPHNMKLRMTGHDYHSRGYYFCTLVVRGRRPLFGRVVAAESAINPSISSLSFGTSRPYRGACVAYSPFGALTVQHIEAMAHRPELEGHLFIKGRIVMPDHIHMLIYIHDSIPHSLGYVLNGFNTGVRQLWRQLEEKGLPSEQEAVPQPQADGSLTIFEPGFHDGLVLKEGQLDSYYEYMRLNPFRILQRQLYPDLFTRRWGRELLSGVRFDLYGNMFLLQRPWREAVRISRYATVSAEAGRAGALASGRRSSGLSGDSGVSGGFPSYILPKRLKTESEVAASLEPYLNMARAGAVLITPCISPAEQALVQAAYAEGLPVIMLAARGFSEGYHPSKAHYDACARGLLLQICPWRYDPTRKLTKDICELLNGFAAQLAAHKGPLDSK